MIAPHREIADRMSQVDNHALGDLRAPDECPMYRCWGPQGPRFTTMYRGTSGPLVNVKCVDFGNLRASGLLTSIRGTSGPLDYYKVKGNLRAFGECTVYRCGDLGLLLCIGGPQGS